MKPILFRTAAGCLAAWLLAAPAPAVAPAETAAVATATAVESLVRATRKPAERERHCFHGRFGKGRVGVDRVNNAGGDAFVRADNARLGD